MAAPMINRRIFLRACASMTMLRAVGTIAQDRVFFEQSASALLLERFGGSDLSWLLLDQFGQVAAQHGFSDRAIAPGSLLKPFVASAYGEQYDDRYPRLPCHGTKDHCWYPHGHGVLAVEEALAQSCNAYFLGLARGLEHNRTALAFQRFGFEGAASAVTATDMIGLTAAWCETPLTIGLAYRKLVSDRSNPNRSRIMIGMEAAAARGTARAAGEACREQRLLAKTGTASCSHHPHATADGFAVLLYPAAEPRILLLVRYHGTTGAAASASAGAMLRALELGAS